MNDRPEIVRQQIDDPGFNINDLTMSLPGTSRRQKGGADYCERFGLRSADLLLGLVSTEDKGKKYSIPKHLADAVADLDDDHQETRDKASKQLKDDATLKEIVDIRYRYEAITPEQRKRLSELIKAKAEEKWKECGGDPRKLGKEFRGGKLAEALIAHAPAELKHCVDTDERFRDFMSSPHTVDDYKKTLDKLGRIAAFSELVERVAAGDNAGEEVKNLAADHKKRSVWHHAKAFAMESHRRLSDGNPDLVSDATDISKAVRAHHAKAATQLYAEIVDSKRFDFYQSVFWKHTPKFLNDKTIDDKLYAETLEKLANKCISDVFDRSVSRFNADELFVFLGDCGEGIGKAKQKELDKQFERVAIVLEARLALILEPRELLLAQRRLIDMYMGATQRGNARDRAKALYDRTLKTIDRLPEESRKRELDHIEREVGKKLK